MKDTKNADMPAMPLFDEDGVPLNPVGWVNVRNITSGLTKREYFAGLAIQGLLARYGNDDDFDENRAKWAVEQADALLAELDK